MKMNEWTVRWLKLHVANTVKQRTLFSYSQIVKLHINPKIGRFDIKEISHELAQGLINELHESGNIKTGGGLSANTVNQVLATLKIIFECAIIEGHIQVNPCSKVRKIKGNQKSIESFTASEQMLIENAVQNNKDRRKFGILLTLYTGLRIGELLALTWEDLDLEENVLKVSKTTYTIKNAEGKWVQVIDVAKTAQSIRVIPLSSVLKKLLLQHKKTGKSKYIIDNKGKLMAVRTYQLIFKKLLIKNNIKTLGFHSLRHTFASKAIGLGIDIKTVSELLGHKNTMITMNLYLHSYLQLKRKAINTISKNLN